MTADDLIEKSEDFFLTRSVIKSSFNLTKLLSILKTRRTNGELRLELSRGGIRTIVLSETAQPDEKESDGIRHILGMNGESS